MLFISFNNRNIKFSKKKLISKIYNINKALLNTKRVQLIDCKAIVSTSLNPANKVFVIYIVYLKAIMSIYPAWETQISLLLIEKVTVLEIYLDFTNVFSKKSAA